MEIVENNNLLNLSGKVAIVTGGAKGIGKGIVKRLAEAEAKVLVADLDELAAQQTANKLIEKGWVAEPFKVDVSNEEEVKSMIGYCQEKFGSVDILINNAGIYPPSPVSQMTQEDFERVMNVNLKSIFLTTKYVAEVMKVQGGGKIINITSIHALHPSMVDMAHHVPLSRPYPSIVGMAHYDASKHGAWGFTKSSALELAKDNITVNAIAPGGIVTPGITAMSTGANDNNSTDSDQEFMNRIPMQRMGEPDEIGKVALFLASSMSSYMTGAQIVVDGGTLLS